MYVLQYLHHGNHRKHCLVPYFFAHGSGMKASKVVLVHISFEWWVGGGSAATAAGGLKNVASTEHLIIEYLNFLKNSSSSTQKKDFSTHL